MDWLVAAVIIAVCVDLNHERKTFHPFLRGEISTETVHGDENLRKKQNIEIYEN